MDIYSNTCIKQNTVYTNENIFDLSYDHVLLRDSDEKWWFNVAWPYASENTNDKKCFKRLLMWNPHKKLGKY